MGTSSHAETAPGDADWVEKRIIQITVRLGFRPSTEAGSFLKGPIRNPGEGREHGPMLKFPPGDVGWVEKSTIQITVRVRFRPSTGGVIPEWSYQESKGRVGTWFPPEIASR